MQRKTIEVLKNFASINSGLIFKKGNKLRTISVMKNVFAAAAVPDEFTKEFAIYDLNEFLSTLSLFDAPELEYKEDHILIKSGRSRVKYFYSSPSVVVGAPDKDLPDLQENLSFTLSKEALDELLKAASVMKLKELAISNAGIKTFNKSSVGNQYNADVENLVVNDDAPERDYVLKIENIKLLPGAYNVKVTARFVQFTSVSEEGLVYFVAVESE